MPAPAAKSITLTNRSTARRTFEVWPEKGEPTRYNLGGKDDENIVGAWPSTVEIPAEHYAKLKDQIDPLVASGKLAAA